MIIKYPTVKKIIETNKKAIKEYRETKAEKHEVLFPGRKKLANTIRRARRSGGDVKMKAAILLEGINQDHAFASANRRTAYLITNNFLWQNKNYALYIRKEKQKKFMQKIRDKNVSRKEIRKWLK